MTDLVYKALLIGNSAFDDPALSRLRGPKNDVRLLQDALVHPQRGLHKASDVKTLVDHRSNDLLLAIEGFFSDARKDDQLLFYYSGHGRSLNHTLYLCTSDTQVNRLVATSIGAQRIHEMITSSPSSRIVIVLDCCHGGLFAGAKGDETFELGVPVELKGRGRYVITSSQGAELSADGDTSTFTRFFAEGLLADDIATDARGFVTVNALYDYVYPRVLERSRQHPQHSVHDAVAHIALARRRPHAAALPNVEAKERSRSPRPGRVSAKVTPVPEVAQTLRVASLGAGRPPVPAAPSSHTDRVSPQVHPVPGVAQTIAPLGSARLPDPIAVERRPPAVPSADAWRAYLSADPKRREPRSMGRKPGTWLSSRGLIVLAGTLLPMVGGAAGCQAFLSGLAFKNTFDAWWWCWVGLGVVGFIVSLGAIAARE